MAGNLRFVSQLRVLWQAKVDGGNKDNVIAYVGEANGLAKSNTFVGNSRNGISVEGKAAPTLSPTFAKETSGAASPTLMSLKVQQRAIPAKGTPSRVFSWGTPQVRPSSVTPAKNHHYGIFFINQVTGTASQNVCSDHNNCDIVIIQPARPALVSNVGKVCRT